MVCLNQTRLMDCPEHRYPPQRVPTLQFSIFEKQHRRRPLSLTDWGLLAHSKRLCIFSVTLRNRSLYVVYQSLEDRIVQPESFEK